MTDKRELLTTLAAYHRQRAEVDNEMAVIYDALAGLETEQPGLRPIPPMVTAQQPAVASQAIPDQLPTACPKHGYEWKEGSSGSRYCSGKTEEAGWSNAKGYCSITPQTAAKWAATRWGDDQ